MADFNLDTDLITHETKIIDDRVVTIVPQTMWTYMIPPYHFMMTPSDGNIFRVTGHLCGEFTGPPMSTFPCQSFVYLRISPRENNYGKLPYVHELDTHQWQVLI